MYRCVSSALCLNGGRILRNSHRHPPLPRASDQLTPAAFSCLLCRCRFSTGSSPLLHWTLNTPQPALQRYMSSYTYRRSSPSAFPVIDGALHPVQRHVFELNLKNSQTCLQRFQEHWAKVLKGGDKNAITRHTQRNRKILARDRIRMLLDDEDFLELSPFAGLGLPYGDIPSAGIFTGIGKINGIWCVFNANDATVKGGTAYPIAVKKQLRAQEVAMQNRLPCVYLVDSGGAFLPLQADIFPDKNHGGRSFYNEARMSAMKIPQVSLVCGSCTAGGAYTPTMAEEAVIVDRIGTIFLGGPPLVKAATGEEVTPEELGGATLHSKVSGIVDHFAAVESEALECVRNIISTLNFSLPEENSSEVEEPVYSAEELLGLAPILYSHSLDVRLIVSRLVDGSRLQEFKAQYGTTLLTGFSRIEGHLVGIVASNGELTYEASLKGSHFVQLCDQRNVPLIFLQNTSPEPSPTFSKNKAESNSNRLKAQGSMMSAVACASVPKITVVVGGCHGAESFAMCGRAFDPNFLFLWPNARVSILAPGHAGALVQDGDDAQQINEILKEESSAFFSSGRLWDDGVIRPQETRKVLGKCLRIIKQKDHQLHRESQHTPLLRI